MGFNFKEYVKSRSDAMESMSSAGTIGLHMVSGPAVGAGLGWLAEYLLATGTKWPLLIGLGIGIIAGFMNVHEDTKRLLNKMKAEDRRAGISRD